MTPTRVHYPRLPTPAEAATVYATARLTLAGGGGRTDPRAVRSIVLAVLFAGDSVDRIDFGGDLIAEESSYAAWQRALAQCS